MSDNIEQPLFGPITPGDLGMQAGYWTDGSMSKIKFKPILGWLTVVNHAQLGARGPVLIPVSANDYGYPDTAFRGTSYVGVFDKGLSEEQALEEYKRWPKPPSGPARQPASN